MPPFTYDPYRNPYAGTIAEMLMRRGEIGARSAENIGGINARATEQRGAAWAGAAQNIGQIAAGIPLQIQQRREQMLVDRERAARTAATEQGTRLDAEANEAGKRAQEALAESLARHRTDDGVDFAAVAADLAAIDPDTAVKFHNLAKGTADVRDSIRTRNRKYASENSYDSAMLAARSPNLETFIGSVDTLVADGLMDEGNRNAVLKRAMAAGEEGWPSLRQEIIKGSPEFEAEQLKTKGAAADTAYKEAQTKALGEPKPPTSFDAAILAAQQAGNRDEVDRLLNLKAREAAASRAPDKSPAASFQAKEVLNDDGKPVMANYDSRTGVYTDITTGQPIKTPKPIPSMLEAMDARKFTKARPILSAVADLSERINTLQGVVAKASGGVEKQKAKINLNDDVAEYESLISGFTPMVARALGHTGVLTQQDVDSVKMLFPRPGDSKSLRDRKVARVMSIVGQLESAAGGAEPPAAAGERIRVVGPNGESGTVPAGTALPAGWKAQ